MGDATRVGLVIGQLHRGGAENQLAKLALGLARDGAFDPSIYCLSSIVEPHGPRLEREGIPVRAFPHERAGRLGRARELRRVMEQDRIRLVHAFLLGPTVHAALATRGSRRAPLVSAIRTGRWERPWLQRRLERWALRRAAVVTVNSTPAAGFVSRYYGLRPERIRFVPNGVEPLGANLPGRGQARDALELAPDTRVILGLFRLSPEKDLETFCAAAEAALADSPDGCCLIAGDGPLRGWLDRRAAAAARPDLFRVLGPRDDVPRLLAAADLMLMTSRSEGMPNGVLEAMAAGLPVVATAVGGIPDLVEEARTGHLCEPGDVEGFAAACRGLFEDDAARRAMGDRSQARAEHEFSVEGMVQSYRSIYDQVLAGEEASRGA